MMNPREDQIQSSEEGVAYDKDLSSITASENVEETCPVSSHGIDKGGSSLALCRVCQCAESDTMANAALAFMNIIITPPSQEGLKAKYDTILLTHKASVRDDVQNDVAHTNNYHRGSPHRERFICCSDVKGGFYQHQDALINLGCSCKSDLAIAHYACALKWFISHGSTVCEICHCVAKNIKPADFKKVKDSLKDYEKLRKMAAAGQLADTHIQTNSDVDPDDAAAAIQRPRLREVSLWFNPHNNSAAPTEVAVPTETITIGLIENFALLLAIAWLTFALGWLMAPLFGKFHIGEQNTKIGSQMRILLGGICALTIVTFLRFVS
ncbi:hypothetical protein AAC387_Pa01g0217 [Persea americana]